MRGERVVVGPVSIDENYRWLELFSKRDRKLKSLLVVIGYMSVW